MTDKLVLYLFNIIGTIIILIFIIVINIMVITSIIIIEGFRRVSVFTSTPHTQASDPSWLTTPWPYHSYGHLECLTVVVGE